MYGSSTSSTSARHVGGVVHLQLATRFRQHAVRDVGRGDEEVEVELPLEALAHDLHVQEAEEAAAEAEAERLRRLGLVEERGVVELQLLECVPQLGVLVGVGREEAREDGRLHVLVAGQRLGGGALLRRQRLADAQPAHVLEPGDDVADLARFERRRGAALGREEAELLGLEARARGHRAHGLARREAAVDHADERDDAAVLVVRGVEDERPRRGLGLALGRRDALDDRVQDRFDSFTGLRRDAQHAVGALADELRHLRGGCVRIGLREVDLVDDRDDLEVVLDREVGVGEGLRLDALRSVDDEERALACLQCARDLVREVDVAGRVDQVELVAAPEDAHGLGLDRDPALALELHAVEHLLPHLPPGQRLRDLEDAVGQRRLPMVDVGDDGEVADGVEAAHG